MPEIKSLQTNVEQKIVVVNGRTSLSSRHTGGETRIVSGDRRSLVVAEDRISTVTPGIDRINVVESSSYILKERVGGVPIPTPDFGGFGFRRMTDTQYTEASSLIIESGERTRLTNNRGIDTNSLRHPFINTLTYHDGKIWPTNSGDTFLVRLSFYASSISVNNHMKVELDIGSVLQDHRQPFSTNSGTSELITINFLVYALDKFRMNGGAFYITTDMEAEIWAVTMLFIPVSSGL